MAQEAIIEEHEACLHVVFLSEVFRFKDDVEFYFDDQAGLVQFRSTSRVGYYDFGVNRKRMEEFSDRYRHYHEKRSMQ
ncbi:DUF1499 domain-containing protein [Thalassobacillus sp. CUG 92003]|uniref:DUF1499 domain-containing protein n=1 Tax=Thalassobacillus sp. CUG 92003 TaxID=2736641 RepID=UPI0015E63814|nr:DUF1499 domain-containing protein [Thalassobacillus sp. CUG 92003]